MAKLNTDELLDAFKEMTLLELSEFVKKFEEVFEVTAAAPVAIAAAGGAAGPAAEAASLPEAVTARHTRVFGGGSYPQLLNISHYATTMQQVTAIWLRRCA